MISKVSIFVALLLCVVFAASAEIFLEDHFTDKNWQDRWVQSEHKSDLGKFELTKDEWYGDDAYSYGLKTSQDARHYAISTMFEKVMESNEQKDLVLQLSVKFPQGIDCGGAYVKVMSEEDLDDPKQYKSDTPYKIMFGPDVCGATKRVHLIFTYKGKNLLWKKTLACETDKLTHVYTAVIKPDNTYEVYIDENKKESGSLVEDWDFLLPEKIEDPESKKPEDWVDEKEIVDPEDKKPEDWDKEPKFINDPEAKKPEDWDDEEDGLWEAPQIPNPEYKGDWKPKMIANPEYKGEWKAPMIDNPEYVADDKLYVHEKLNRVGIEVWQVKSGTVFGNMLVTDDVDYAKETTKNIIESNKKEKEMFDKIEEEKNKKQEEERKKREEEEKARKEEEEKNKPTEEPKPLEEETKKQEDADVLKEVEEMEKINKETEKADIKDEL